MNTPTSWSYRLARFLRDKRIEHGLSQEEAAKRLGWTQTEVSRLERGFSTRPPFGSVIQLGTSYGTTPNSLARAAGLWTDNKDSRDGASRLELARLEAILADLPPERRTELITTLENFALSTRNTWARADRVEVR